MSEQYVSKKRVVKKTRHEVQFEPKLDEVLKGLAKASQRSLKSMLENLAIEYAEKQTGMKFTNKIKIQ